jgi:hypothetical protein
VLFQRYERRGEARSTGMKLQASTTPTCSKSAGAGSSAGIPACGRWNPETRGTSLLKRPTSRLRYA